MPGELARLPGDLDLLSPSFLWAAGSGSGWWGVSVLRSSQPFGGRRVRGDAAGPLLGELVLQTGVRPGCKLYQIKNFCRLLISVPFQLVCLRDAVRTTEIPAAPCQTWPCGIYALLLGPKLEIRLKSGILRLGGMSLHITRKLLGFPKHYFFG